MKPLTYRLFALAVASLLLPAILPAQDETPTIPVGSLSAYPEIVQTGTHPELSWQITVPETIDDIVDIEGPGTLRPKRCLVMDVRVLGASVKRVWRNQNGQVVDWEWVPTETRIKYNDQSYDRLFFDTHDDVNPSAVAHSQTVEENDSINFGARYVTSNGHWSTWFSSTNSDYNVIALKDGDTPPTTTPLYEQPTIESFILPYLDEEGKINLGARDIIFLMELTHTNRDHGGFDLQDMALLVTFYEEVQTDVGPVDCHGNSVDNNGHGNNEDGVDASNPGSSLEGEDSDPTVDDESGSGNGSARGRRHR